MRAVVVVLGAALAILAAWVLGRDAGPTPPPARPPALLPKAATPATSKANPDHDHDHERAGERERARAGERRREPGAPLLLLDEPADGSISLTGSPVWVRGEVVDEDLLSLEVNGHRVKVDAKGAFRFPLALPFGEQVVEVVARDRAGHRTAIKVRVVRRSPLAPELEERLDRWFAKMRRLAERREVDALIESFGELRALQKRYAEHGAEQLIRKRMDRLMSKRPSDYGTVSISIKLQIYLNEGEYHLRRMADHIRRGQPAKALALLKKVEALRKEMRAEMRKVYHTNGDALLARASALAKRARALSAPSSSGRGARSPESRRR